MNFMKRLINYLKILPLLVILFSMSSYSQTTGKISGKVSDFNNGDTLFGVNITIAESTWGAATDIDGNFSILNIPPGKYDLVFQMIGYEKMTIQGIVVSVNRTTSFDIQLKEVSVELGQEVVVIASRVSMKKDQTSSIRNVTEDQISSLPVQSVDEVVEMQSGVVAGHFRGGRSTEVTYMIDGLVIDNSFAKDRKNINVETDVVQEIEVITGTFNAEYGNAMSGIVNAITKDGRNKLEGSVSVGGSNYITTHDDIWYGLDDIDARNQDFKVYLSGPIIKDYVSFVVNGRYQEKKNQYSAIKLFNENDYSDFTTYPNWYYSEKNGDSSIVPFSNNKSYSLYSKLSFKPFVGFRSSITYTRNYDKYRNYSGNHNWKYNPDGLGYNYSTADMVALQINHSLNNKMFYEFKASYLNNLREHYLYEDPLDARYVSDYYNRDNAGFKTGGQDKSWWTNEIVDINAKLDFTWQIDHNHVVKTGLAYTNHQNDIYSAEIRNEYFNTPLEYQTEFDTTNMKLLFPNYIPVIMPDSSQFTTAYRAKPIEAAWYIQDKMEYEDMVVNLGLRLDYFDPNTVYPTDWRNPANDIHFADENSEKYSDYVDAKAQIQLSPRVGLSYQLGDQALLRFAYGHFFQMPPLNMLYGDAGFQVSPNDMGTLMHNPNLKPQKTIQYEVGLWQQLNENMSLEVAVYYRDIYDLLSTKVLYTYNLVRYGQYTNLDYGNVKGLEFKYDYLFDKFSFFMNYTLQFTRGNSANPELTFDRAGGNLDPVKELYRMDWDQRHTLNASLNYDASDYGATVTAYYNSGTPYTWKPIVESSLYLINLDFNNSVKPSTFQVDLRAYYDLFKNDDYSVRLNLLVYNLFDSLLDRYVYDETGKSYENIVKEIDVDAWRSDFNTIYDPMRDPSMYHPPREVKLSLDFRF